MPCGGVGIKTAGKESTKRRCTVPEYRKDLVAEALATDPRLLHPREYPREGEDKKRKVVSEMPAARSAGVSSKL